MVGISGILYVLLATTYIHLNRLAKVSVFFFVETVMHSCRKCLDLGK
jgi:hypothetical protein